MRMRVMSAAIAASIVVAGFTIGQVRAQDTGARAAIEAVNKRFSAAFDKGDAAGIAALYTTDGAAFPPGGDIVRGRDAIQKMWGSVFAMGITSAVLETTEVDAAGSLAYEIGTYALKTKDGTVADKGKYCVVWKRVGTDWLLHRDIWNTSVAPAK